MGIVKTGSRIAVLGAVAALVLAACGGSSDSSSSGGGGAAEASTSTTTSEKPDLKVKILQASGGAQSSFLGIPALKT